MQLEAGVFLQPEEIQGDHGHIVHAGLCQRLAEQVDVVGGPAAAAGLGDEQGHLVGIIAAALEWRRSTGR